ncbi:uncharacterized PE-PGRS family protein PE_PGRS20-like [Rosa chinensis]|uniref:uncharacterized PE-PGRS family protein PE_PGRS20-like n=1 Tax=Rosa chinensis TaxID=74649 RepID=UPI000D0932DC|nr:uncharacterized PE-PGRS family protein PE_PGRS20-like [Rosa chinensis]
MLKGGNGGKLGIDGNGNGGSGGKLGISSGGVNGICGIGNGGGRNGILPGICGVYGIWGIGNEGVNGRGRFPEVCGVNGISGIGGTFFISPNSIFAFVDCSFIVTFPFSAALPFSSWVGFGASASNQRA